MENQELENNLPDDLTAADSSQLNQEIAREEGSGSWDELEQEDEEDTSGELEASQETDDSTEETQEEELEQEEEEGEQKNTLEDSSRRVLSFKDFFSQN